MGRKEEGKGNERMLKWIFRKKGASGVDEDVDAETERVAAMAAANANARVKELQNEVDGVEGDGIVEEGKGKGMIEEEGGDCTGEDGNGEEEDDEVALGAEDSDGFRAARARLSLDDANIRCRPSAIAMQRAKELEERVERIDIHGSCGKTEEEKPKLFPPRTPQTLYNLYADGHHSFTPLSSPFFRLNI